MAASTPCGPLQLGLPSCPPASDAPRGSHLPSWEGAAGWRGQWGLPGRIRRAGHRLSLLFCDLGKRQQQLWGPSRASGRHSWKAPWVPSLLGTAGGLAVSFCPPPPSSLPCGPLPGRQLPWRVGFPGGCHGQDPLASGWVQVDPDWGRARGCQEALIEEALGSEPRQAESP